MFYSSDILLPPPFRYAPMSYPTVMKFSVDGVTLMEHMYNCNKVTCTINLDNLGQKSSGSYRCEISGDAPEFKLISKTANLTIAGQLVNIFLWGNESLKCV